METDEHWAIKAIDFFFVIFVGRALVVSSFFVGGCLMLGVPLYKAATLFAITYVAQVGHLGRRSIEKVAMIFLACATMYWIDIVPVKEWAQASQSAVRAALRPENGN